MIIKHIHRSSRWPQFRTGCRSREDMVRLIAYLQRPTAKPSVIRNDFAGNTPKAIADQVAELHSDQPVWAYHVVARFPANEAELWNPKADQLTAEIDAKFRIPMSLWVRHDDHHWHGVLLAFKPLGRQIRLQAPGKDGKMLLVASVLRAMAEDWEDRTPGCKTTGRSDPEGLSLGRDALAMAVRQYRQGTARTPIPEKLLLRADIGHLVHKSNSIEDLLALASAYAISVHLKKEGDKVLGISFSRNGVSIRGRDAGFSYQKLREHYDNPRATIHHSHLAKRTLPRNRRSRGRPTTSRDYRTHHADQSNDTVAGPLQHGLAAVVELLDEHQASLDTTDDLMQEVFSVSLNSLQALANALIPQTHDNRTTDIRTTL